MLPTRCFGLGPGGSGRSLLLERNSALARYEITTTSRILRTGESVAMMTLGLTRGGAIQSPVTFIRI